MAKGEAGSGWIKSVGLADKHLRDWGPCIGPRTVSSLLRCRTSGVCLGPTHLFLWDGLEDGRDVLKGVLTDADAERVPVQD